MHASELWGSNRLTARLARAALAPTSWLYALGWEAYLAAYQLGLKKPKEPHRPVICVGNLQVGGSGKSPLCLFLAGLIQSLGHEVVISCSGYGSPKSEEATHAPEGPLRAREWGDEAAMFRWLCPDLPLIVGRNRVAAAHIAHGFHPDAVLLLDDGFQHLPLKKHLTILLDPLEPSNRFCLPAGPYREPRWNRKRADLTIPGEFQIETEPMTLATPDGQPVQPSEYVALCALGRPDRFIAALALAFPKKSEAHPPRLFSDHDPLTAGNLFENLSKDIPIVVTAKDWVKLRDRSDIDQRQILVAKHEVRVTPAGRFSSWLSEKLHA